MIGFAASFAAKLADTFGSEVGKRWGRRAVLTTLHAWPEGHQPGETLAGAAGNVVMTLVMWQLQLLPSFNISLVVMLIGLVATLAESLLGAVAQDRISWLSNELVNALQTLLAALMVMLLMAGRI